METTLRKYLPTHMFGDTEVSQVVLEPRPVQGGVGLRHSSSLGPEM